MGNVTAIPEGKGTPEEKNEYESFRNGENNLYEPGIRVNDEGFYNPDHEPKYGKNVKPEPTYGPLLATDPGQPDNLSARVVSRESSKPIERPESRPTGRRAKVDKP